MLIKHVRDKFLVDDGCWEWTAAKSSGGYGRLRANGKLFQAHRVVYELLVGPIPEGTQIDHLCRNRACVNPAHMEPVSQATNIARGLSAPAENARKTHCIRGHPFDEDNLVDLAIGWRRCKTCHAMRERQYRARRRP